jgi:pSer/pThr/pTyr-binding forkhead associated (FHA) protein
MVYSAPKEQQKQKQKQRPGGRLVETRAIVALDDRRYVLEGPTAVIGRSKEADCVFRDPNISRRHAELRRGPTGDWQIVDLGSTNGVKVNDRRVDKSRLSPGDEVVLGTTRFVFDIEQ